MLFNDDHFQGAVACLLDLLKHIERLFFVLLEQLLESYTASPFATSQLLEAGFDFFMIFCLGLAMFFTVVVFHSMVRLRPALIVSLSPCALSASCLFRVTTAIGAWFCRQLP